jgi:aspartate--ammonia ligase
VGIRVDRASLGRQLELTGQLEFLRYPYHQAILHGEIPLSIGEGIGQSRTLMLLLRKAHLSKRCARRVIFTCWSNAPAARPPALQDV